MAFAFGLLLFVSLAGIETILGQRHGQSLMCRDCNHVTDPAHCLHYMSCPDEQCGMTVFRNASGFTTFHLSCLGPHECDGRPIPIGKRGHHPDFGHKICQECCSTAGCNDHLCSTYLPTHAHISLPPKTTQKPTTLPTTTQHPCHDVEDDNFQCNDYDKYHFCTDSAGLPHELALFRCRKHCGFCTDVPCVNNEDDLFNCQTYDKQFDLCHDPSPFSVKMAHEHCPLYCGFCLADGTIVKQTSPATAITTTTIPATPISAVISMEVSTATAVCEDNEDETFSCSEWTTHGYCGATSGTLLEISKARCSKTCNLCP